MKPEILAELCAELEARLAPFAEAGEDFRANIRAVAEAVLGKMDVVSRAEFDEQNALLAQAAAKLEGLEKKVAALEEKAAKKRAAAAKKAKN